MPEMNELSLKQRLEALKEDLNKDCPVFADRLQEKGVEIAILVPIFEVIMGFDGLRDVKYEYTSDKRFERFDFLLDEKLLIEAKRLNTVLDGNVIKQVEKYISHHDKFNYGILSNGSEFAFFIKSSFIKEFLAPEETFQIEVSREVIHVLTISIFDENFFGVMKLFSKASYHEMFSRLARFALTRINQSRVTKIVDDKDLNTWIQDRVSECIDIKHGYYLKDIQNGKIKVGQELCFDNGLVKIKVVVLNDGRIKLIKGTAIVLNLNQTMESEFRPMIDLVMGDWKKEDFIFNSTEEVIKVATGRERLRKGAYDFK